MADREDGAIEADSDAPRTGWRDLAIVVGVVLVFVAVVWVALDALPEAGPGPAADVTDLERFDEIDLGELAGADVQFGVTRSELLPALVGGGERGETSLAIIDTGGRVIDAGPVPGEGWLVEGYPRASDRYVAMLTNWCDGEPVDGDTGLECRQDVEAVRGQLTVYDIGRGRWSTTLLDEPLVGSVELVDVDGAVATLHRYPRTPKEPDLWSQVDLTKPLAVGAFVPGEAPRPNGLIESRGHYDGWGWKASGVGGWETETTWTGTIDGRPATQTIADAGERRFGAAGECLVIASYRPERLEQLDRLHQLCAS